MAKKKTKKTTKKSKRVSKKDKIKDLLRAEVKSLFPKRPPRGRVSELNLDKLAEKISKL